ncbi:MAG: RNA-guided endonuclease IscB, partial [Planctomycetota bacterium]
RGHTIRHSLESRRGVRRGRRSRHTRYRPPRFLNRTRPEGWLSPSLMSRVFNVATWAKRLLGFLPISSMAIETVRFDFQKMLNPEITGVEYQQGTLEGYEIREYLLEKFKRTCVYCKKKEIPLQIEHMVPKSRGGTNRVSNLTLACEKCNSKKGTQTAEEFGYSEVQKQAKTPLKDACAVNATRYKVGEVLKALGLPVSFWSGGRTKFNRCAQGYKKDHWIDAACVGKTGEKVSIQNKLTALEITAMGRGSRQMCLMNRYGFPRTKAKKLKSVHGFQTGDIVKAVVPSGKKKGSYFGRVAIRESGSFNIKTKGATIEGISWKYCRKLQAVDGYAYR